MPRASRSVPSESALPPSPTPTPTTPPRLRDKKCISSRVSPFCASQASLQRFCICRRIYAWRAMFCEKHMNLYTIFKRAQLFERFYALQWRRFPPHKIEQRFSPKTVDPLMPQIFDRGRAIAREGDGVARKIKCVALEIDDHLNLVRRRRFGRIGERMRAGDNVDLGIGAQRFYKAIEQAGLGQRFVALNIKDQIELAAFANDLSHAVGATLMALRGHGDLGAPVESSPGNAHVVGRDDHCVQFFCADTAFPHVPKKRFVCNEMQRFSRKTR